ncbi:MAG: peptidoglycan editing factor PgeF [Gammaproteobacteria bacterium]|nr:peptidoglycan editing factor PgeF [Gammaproteobacteria bacterium]
MPGNWITADWPAPAGVVAGTTTRTGDLAELALAATPCWLNQVHGAEVVAASNHDAPPSADASVSRSRDMSCVIRTADCLPVLLCAVDGSCIAAAHAGWRGLAAGVIENTVEKMAAADTEVMAWLGPAISQACFEVGGEVREAFVGVDAAAESCFQANERRRYQADLYGLARQRLARAGITKVFGGGLCTYSDSERFFSYRRDADCGRMISFIALK